MGSFKARRKQSKYRQILKSDLNIDITDEPTKSLMVGNAGLVSGVRYEQLAELFTEYGNVKKIIMIPKKSYSFVVFTTECEASKAFDAINGRIKLDNMDGPMFMVYTNSVPSQFETPIASSLPDGLSLLCDFVSCAEEERLLKCVCWDTVNLESGKTLKHRRVKHYGYEFRYDNNNVDKDCPLNEGIPDECEFVRSRLVERGHPLPWTPNQLTVNQYQKGQGIPSHVDTHSAFESPILSLSLGSDVVMEFRRGSQHIPVLLPRRSLLIMDREARYAWSHGIVPRTQDVVEVSGGLTVRDRGCRTSFTLRRVRPGPCDCHYPSFCDSQRPPPPLITDQQANQLEEIHVHKVYSNIASHFSETRTKVWPNVQQFLLSFPLGSILVDAGCGNGKYFGVNPNIFQVGFDRSSGLAEISHSRGHQVFVSDCLTIPLRNGAVDGVICVAVLHHLSTIERRLQALSDLTRILVPGGRALVTVWAKSQTKDNKTAYLKQDRKNRRKDNTEERHGAEREELFKSVADLDLDRAETEKSQEDGKHEKSRTKSTQDKSCLENTEFKLPVHTARTEFQHQDVFVPWKVKSNNSNHNSGEVFLRYYHVFEENELAQLCSSLNDINILETYYTEGNWCIILEKVKLLDL